MIDQLQTLPQEHLPSRAKVLCPCGTIAHAYDGVLMPHVPLTEVQPDGQQRPLINDAYGSCGCRYTLRAVTLDAALARENILNPAEQTMRDGIQDDLERGMVFTAPHGYGLPKGVVNLLALTEANGWGAVQMWMPANSDSVPTGDGYVLNIRVGRAENWWYDLCWLVTPDVAEEIKYGLLSCSPEISGAHFTPPIRVIRKVISKSPLPKGGELLPHLGTPRYLHFERWAGEA